MAAITGTERRFERQAKKWDRIYDGTGPWTIRAWNAATRTNVRRRFDTTFNAIPAWNGAAVLDIGCGSGRYLARAASLGAARLTGVDVSAEMLDLAAKGVEAAGGRAELHRGLFPDTSVQGTFDVVLVVGVLDYSAEPGRLIAGAARCCAGCVIATFPRRLAPRSVPRAAYWRMRGLRTRYYTRAEVSRLVADAGLRTQRIARIGPILFLVAAPATSNPR